MASLSNILVINYQVLSNRRRRVSPTEIAWLPSTLPAKPSRVKEKSLTTNESVVHHRLNQSASRSHKMSFSNLVVQYLALFSESSGKKEPVCAIFRDDCARSYISKRIVKRLSLASYMDFSANTSPVTAGGSKITPSRNYVTLVIPTKAGIEQTPYPFYVVEHYLERFDILIGSNIITNLSSSAKT